MTYDEVCRRSISLVILVAAISLSACDEATPDDEGTKETQTAESTVSPLNATIAQGSTTAMTVTFTVTGGLTIGSSYSINKPLAGITVVENSRQTVGGTTTLSFTVGADGTVPAGTYTVHVTTPVTGYTGTGAVPTASVAFPLTVTV